MAMETKSTHRRTEDSTIRSYNLMHKLAILLRTHKESKFTCSATSVAYRVACLCDLSITGHIELRGEKVCVVKSHSDPLMNEFLIKIAQINGAPSEIIKQVNGEKKKENGIKHLKKKLYKEINSTNVIQRERGILKNKIVLKDNETWKRIFDHCINDCLDGRPSINTRVLLICLEYINQLHDVVVQLPTEKTNIVHDIMQQTRREIVDGTYKKSEELPFLFMKYLVKNKVYYF